MAEYEGITEQLKAEDQLEWVRRMNNILNLSMDIVNAELIFRDCEKKSVNYLPW